MKNQNLIRLSQGILATAIAIGVILILIHMVKPYFIGGIFENYVGQSWEDFMNQQPRQASLYVYLVKMAHCFYLMGMLFALYILFTNYGRGEKMAWLVLLVGAVIANVTPIVFGKIFSDPAGIRVGIIGLIVDLVALSIGAIPIWTTKAVISGDR